MSAYLLTIGDEVLSGKVLNTNASYLAQQLGLLGIVVRKVVTVGDNLDSIIAAVNDFLNSESSILITTGGLGPTADDMTKIAISKALGLNLRYNEIAAHDMFLYFGTEKSDCNRNQVYFPEGSEIISNDYGSADGAVINYKGKLIILLVGPPSELKPMFNKIIPKIKNKQEKLKANRMLYGQSESYFENLLSPLIKGYPELKIMQYTQNGVITYNIVTERENQNAFTSFCQQFDYLAGDYLYSKTSQQLNEVLVEMLIKANLSISFAESCTGGLLAKLITDVPGASQILSQSIITYSNEAKINLLGVNRKTIAKYGDVSLNVTEEMVYGLQRIGKADIYASISGYAGPSGEKGKICYSIKFQDLIINQEKKFRGTRDMIRSRAANDMMYQIIQLVKRKL